MLKNVLNDDLLNDYKDIIHFKLFRQKSDLFVQMYNNNDEIHKKRVVCKKKYTKTGKIVVCI
jgi:hypothetical protein